MRVLLVAFVVLTACGKKSDSPGAAASGKVASCMSEGMHSCREYRDANLALGTDSLAQLCTTVDKTAKFTDAACPTADVIGTCKFNEGKDFYYSGYPITERMEEACKGMGGTFAK